MGKIRKRDNDDRRKEGDGKECEVARIMGRSKKKRTVTNRHGNSLTGKRILTSRSILILPHLILFPSQSSFYPWRRRMGERKKRGRVCEDEEDGEGEGGWAWEQEIRLIKEKVHCHWWETRRVSEWLNGGRERAERGGGARRDVRERDECETRMRRKRSEGKGQVLEEEERREVWGREEEL